MKTCSSIKFIMRVFLIILPGTNMEPTPPFSKCYVLIDFTQ